MVTEEMIGPAPDRWAPEAYWKKWASTFYVTVWSLHFY